MTDLALMSRVVDPTLPHGRSTAAGRSTASPTIVPSYFFPRGYVILGLYGSRDGYVPIDQFRLLLKHAKLFWAIVAAAGCITTGSPSRALGDSGVLPLAVSQVRVREIVKAEPTGTLSDLASLAQIAAGIAAVFALPFLAWQVRAGRRNAMSDRTATLQSEWGSRRFLTELSPVIAFLDVESDIDDCIKKICSWERSPHAESPSLPRSPPDPSAPSPCANDVLHVLLFCEDLCQRYNAKEIDHRLVASSIGPELLGQFARGSWFIHWQRAAERDDFLFGEWEETLLDLRANESVGMRQGIRSTPHCERTLPSS